MFRRFADRVSSAVASVASSNNSTSNPTPEQQLTSMGFSSADARHALQLHGNNVEQAMDWLLSNNNGNGNISPGMQATTQMMEEDDLQRALAASLEDSNNNNSNNNTTTVRSAASRRAGQAALARFEQKNTTKTTNAKTKNRVTTTAAAATTYTSPATSTPPQPIAASHPNVKLPKQLSHHEKEEQILRCANRMAPHPKAVDMVLKSLRQLQQNPNNTKFHTIDLNKPIFTKHFQNVPGVVDFFKAMNYHSSPNNIKVLQLSYCDPATLYLGISALEQVQETSDIYKQNKRNMEFDHQIETLLSTTSSNNNDEETKKKAEYLSKCPSEPTAGGSFMQVQIGGNTATKISRKFDADDTLQDVLHWIAGSTSPVIYDKLIQHEWYLINQNQNGAYNMKTGPAKTLQALGCWPSGRLQVLPTLPEHDMKNTSSRGLGAAGIASDYL